MLKFQVKISFYGEITIAIFKYWLGYLLSSLRFVFLYFIRRDIMVSFHASSVCLVMDWLGSKAAAFSFEQFTLVESFIVRVSRVVNMFLKEMGDG